MPFVAWSEEGLLEFMHYVYILRSINFSEQIYNGYTTNIKERLKAHNNGSNKHTSKFKPWKMIWCGVFTSEAKAKAFETYLKTASGIAFKRKRLI